MASAYAEITHYVMVPPAQDEFVRYFCQEYPCKEDNLAIMSGEMDIHATKVHGSGHISARS